MDSQDIFTASRTLRSKFELDIQKIKGNRGIGVISDYKDQTVLIRSHLGQYALVTVCAVKNSDDLMKNLFDKKMIDFSEMRRGEINPTELTAALISQESTFEERIHKAHADNTEISKTGRTCRSHRIP